MITVDNVYKRYKSRSGYHTVLKGINLSIAPGERLGILGKNGSGKSTLIRIISGQEIPDKGKINRGMNVSWPLAFTGGFQGSLTGFDNTRFIARIYNIEYDHVRGFVEEFAELGKYFYEPVKHYSSGMQARLAFALTLAIEFDCYLIDEVIAVGDGRFQEKCNYELFEKRKDRTFVMASHSPKFIKKHCTRAAVIEDGVMTCYDSVEEAYEYYAVNILGISPNMEGDLD